MTARAFIVGCSGLAITPDERAFFRDADPWGFILFQRNIEGPDQVRALTASLRESVGRDDAPILIIRLHHGSGVAPAHAGRRPVDEVLLTIPEAA